MGLQGSLRDMPALEAIEYVGSHRKTTTLRLESSGQRAEFHFYEGSLIAAHLVARTGEQPFIDTLVVLAHISPPEAIRLREQIAVESKDPWRLVCEIPHLSMQTCQSVYLLATEGMVDRVLLWKDGHFAFLPLATSERIFDPPIKVDTILLDAVRRLDELASWKHGALAPHAVPCLYGPEELYVSTDPLRRAILRQIDGRRNLSQIVEASHLAEHNVYATVEQGIEEGWIQLLSPPAVSEGSHAQRGEVRRRSPAVVAILVIAAAGMGSMWYGQLTMPHDSVWEEARARWEEVDLRRSIELYRHRHGSYPLELGALEDEIHPTRPGFSHRWLYGQDGEAYLLRAR